MANPKAPQYEVGMIVEHPQRPMWGPGKVVAVTADRVHVIFRDDLARKAKAILRSLVSLRVAENQADDLLDRLPPAREEHGDWLLPANYERSLKKLLAS